MSNIIMLQNTFYVEVIIISLLTVQVSCEKIFNRELHFLAIKFNFQIKGLCSFNRVLNQYKCNLLYLFSSLTPDPSNNK